VKISDTPFSIIAFAPFLADETPGQQQSGLPLAISSADQGLALLAPSLYIPLPRSMSPDCGIQLAFTRLDDFTPESIVARTAWLKALATGSQQERKAGASSVVQHDALDSILDMIALPEGTADSAHDDTNRLTEADSILAGVLNRIFSDAAFRQMEAAWRGVALLLDSSCCGPVALSIVPVQRDTAVETIEKAASYLDDDPPDLILLDAGFDATPAGMLLLESVSSLAERLMSPALCWCGPEFFYSDRWDGLAPLPYLPNHLDGFSYARWKTLRARPAAFWTMAFCNGLTIRQPYRCDALAGFFKESSPLTAPAVWGAAALMQKAFTVTGNPCKAGLQKLQLFHQEGEQVQATETVLPDERCQQLLASGILPLVPMRSGAVGIAQLVTIDRGSPARAVALSWTIHTLIRLRKEYGPAEEGETVVLQLQEAFSGYLQTPVFTGVNTITIDNAGTNRNGTVVLGVRVKPDGPQQTEIIEFTFDW